MTRNLKSILGIAGAAAVVTGAFLAGRALAGGIPATAALTYSGTLEDATGAALTGSHNVQVFFWNAATSGASVCNTTSSPIALDAGRFSVALPDTCTAAVKASPNIWAEVLVDGASLGRTKIGAVPYAVEAGHATNADNATNATAAATANAAGGALKTTIDGLAPSTTVPKITPWSPIASADMTPFTVLGTNGYIAGSTTTATWRQVGDTVQLRSVTTWTTPLSVSGWIEVTLPSYLWADLSVIARGNVGSMMVWGSNQGEMCQADLSSDGKALYGYCGASVFTTGSPYSPPTEVDFDVSFPVKGWTVTQ